MAHTLVALSQSQPQYVALSQRKARWCAVDGRMIIAVIVWNQKGKSHALAISCRSHTEETTYTDYGSDLAVAVLVRLR
jgi:hypothetical protein